MQESEGGDTRDLCRLNFLEPYPNSTPVNLHVLVVVCFAQDVNSYAKPKRSLIADAAFSHSNRIDWISAGFAASG